VIAPDLIEYRPVEVMSSIPTILVNCLDPNASVTNIVPDEQGAGSAAARVLIEGAHLYWRHCRTLGRAAEPAAPRRDSGGSSRADDPFDSDDAQP
jgi:hypothetical protein